MQCVLNGTFIPLWADTVRDDKLLRQGCPQHGSRKILLKMLGFKNKIFYLIKAVRRSSVKCSSVKTEPYFDLTNCSVEYEIRKECVVPKMEICL